MKQCKPHAQEFVGFLRVILWANLCHQDGKAFPTLTFRYLPRMAGMVVPMRRPLGHLVLFALLWLIPAMAQAGAWTQPKGGGYLKAWFRLQAALGFLDGYHDEAGDNHYTDNYSETGFALYGEYGITDWLTLIGAWAPVKVYHLQQQGGVTVVRPDDPLFGFRFGLLQKELRVSLQVDTRVPAVTDRSFGPFFAVNKETGVLDEPLGVLRVGSGVWDIEPRVQLGYGSNRGHWGVEVGWRFRTGGFQDALVWLMEGGYRFVPRFYATVRIAQIQPRGATPPPPKTGSLTGVWNGTTYFGFAFEFDTLIGDLDNQLSIGVVIEGATFYERQAGGPILNLYLAKKWD